MVNSDPDQNRNNDTERALGLQNLPFLSLATLHEDWGSLHAKNRGLETGNKNNSMWPKYRGNPNFYWRGGNPTLLENLYKPWNKIFQKIDIFFMVCTIFHLSWGLHRISMFSSTWICFSLSWTGGPQIRAAAVL